MYYEDEPDVWYTTIKLQKEIEKIIGRLSSYLHEIQGIKYGRRTRNQNTKNILLTN